MKGPTAGFMVSKGSVVPSSLHVCHAQYALITGQCIVLCAPERRQYVESVRSASFNGRRGPEY